MCVVLEGVLASLQLEAQDFQVRLLVFNCSRL
jgi:hypothetical protein